MNFNIWGDFQICISVPLSNTEAELKKGVAYKKSVNFIITNKSSFERHMLNNLHSVD